MANKLTPLDPIDAAWFHMNRPANEVAVTSMLLTETPLDIMRVKGVFGSRLMRFPRFRQRIVESGFPVATPHWEDDPYFDLDAHIHHMALPEPGDHGALLELVSDLASTSLDYNRPLWQIHVVDHVGRGSALVLRFHHCIGDGTAMIALAGQLLDRNADGIPFGPPPAPRPPASPIQQMIQPALNQMGQPNGAAKPGGNHKGPDPLQMVAQGVGTALLSVLKPADPSTPLKGRLSGKQRVAFSAPVPLPEVKAIGAGVGAKVNDVLVAAMTGALRHYLGTHHARLDGLHIRAVVPVDLRRPERALDLGNRFGLTFLDLPVGQGEPLERLRETKQGMDAIKRSPEAIIFQNILSVFGQTPKAVEDIAADVFGSKATLVMTNVMGPGQQLYVAGSPIRTLIFWVPHPVTLGLGISILSYNGQVTLGVIADASVIPDPETITAQFNQEFLRLREASGVSMPARTTCAATTQAGKPCKNRPLESGYCRVHQAKG